MIHWHTPSSTTSPEHLRNVSAPLPSSLWTSQLEQKTEQAQVPEDTENRGPGSSRRGTAKTNPTGNQEVAGSIPGLAQWVKDLASCGVGCRWGSDLALLWLWHRPGATAPIRPLAWEPPYAEGAALKRRKTNK